MLIAGFKWSENINTLLSYKISYEALSPFLSKHIFLKIPQLLKSQDFCRWSAAKFPSTGHAFLSFQNFWWPFFLDNQNYWWHYWWHFFKVATIKSWNYRQPRHNYLGCREVTWVAVNKGTVIASNFTKNCREKRCSGSWDDVSCRARICSKLTGFRHWDPCTCLVKAGYC